MYLCPENENQNIKNKVMRIKEIMKKQGVTQIELADTLGITAVSAAINGDCRISTLKKIATALNVRVGELFDYSPEDVKLMHQLGKEQYALNTQELTFKCPHCHEEITIKIIPAEKKNKG